MFKCNFVSEKVILLYKNGFENKYYIVATIAYIFIFRINYIFVGRIWRKGVTLGNVSVGGREITINELVVLFGVYGICGESLFNTYSAFYVVILLVSQKPFHISTHLFCYLGSFEFRAYFFRMWFFRVVVVDKVFGQYGHSRYATLPNARCLLAICGSILFFCSRISLRVLGIWIPYVGVCIII